MNPLMMQEFSRAVTSERVQSARQVQLVNEKHAARKDCSRRKIFVVICLGILIGMVGAASINGLAPKPMALQPDVSEDINAIEFEPNPASCTTITATDSGMVLFGNNEDRYEDPNVVVGFFPATTVGYGSVHVGLENPYNGSLRIHYEGAMNDQGLAWDLNGLPPSDLNPHPERPYSHAFDNYLTQITKHAATVEEAIEMANLFDFGSSMAWNLHIADASGDAVIISAGPDGELAFTRRAAGDGHLISTNFNPANPSNRTPLTGAPDRRHDTASQMLEQIAMGPATLTPDYMASILDAVHMEYPLGYTVYSNIFDLKNQMLYLVYLTRYDEMVALDVAYELSLGEHVYEARDLISQQAVDSGMKDFRTAKTLGRGGSLAVGMVVLASIVVALVLVVRWVRRLRTGRAAPATAETS